MTNKAYQYICTIFEVPCNKSLNSHFSMFSWLCADISTESFSRLRKGMRTRALDFKMLQD